ncbi:MAG: GNAT family N-acetyltransferase [Phaeodactylibacter sp.]|nr:GNAT family N-acetyltransferase [Phaeodactylibacter sp.]
MDLERIEEWQIPKATHAAIRQLLGQAFPHYPDRSYYQQVPSFRLLARQQEQLIGHVAVTFRVINAGGEPFSVFGLGDVCVHPDFQNRKVGSQLLQYLTELGQLHGIDFLVLIAADHALYLANGFVLVENVCRWQVIKQQASFGIRQGRLPDSVLVKALTDKVWPEGLIDFLGSMF